MRLTKLPLNAYIVLILAAITLIVFYPALGFFFSRDDFGFFPRASYQWWDLQHILAPYVGWFYRPVSQQLFFYLGYKAFGLNSFWFHLINVFFHFLNSVLLYLIILRLTKNKLASLVGASFFVANRVHLMSVYWISAFSEVGAAFFYFLTFLLFLRYLDTKKLIYISVSLPLFILGLFSKEMLVTIPLVMALYLLIFGKFQKTKGWFIQNGKIIAPSLLLPLAFLIFYKKFVTLPTGPYPLDFSPITAAKAAFRYLAGVFVSSYDQADKVSLLNALLVIRVGIVVGALFLVVKKFLRKKKAINLPNYLFGLGWFFLTMLPVLFIPAHAFPYYMTIPLLGLCLITTCLFVDLTKKFTRNLTILCAGLLIALNVAAGALDQEASNYLGWVREMQAGARIATDSLRGTTFQPNETVFMTPSTEKSQAILFFGELIRVQHIDQNLTVKFLEKNSLDHPPAHYKILKFGSDSRLTDITASY